MPCDGSGNDGTCGGCIYCRPRPIFPSEQNPLYNPTPIVPSSPQWPYNPINPNPLPNPQPLPIPPPNPQPLQPFHPIGPQPSPLPIPPPNPQPIQPIYPLGPSPNPPSGPSQPVGPLIPPSPSGGPQGIEWLLFGGDTNLLLSQGFSAAGLIDLLAIGGTDIGLTAYLGPIALIATAISFGIMGLIDLFSGRPKLQATENLSLYANSPSPVLSGIGKAAALGVKLGIPFSTSNPSDWGGIFYPDILSAFQALQVEYPDYTNKQLEAVFSIILQEMGNPQSHQPIVIRQLLLDELKKGTIKIPTMTNGQARVQPKTRRLTNIKRIQNAKLTRAT